MCCLLVHGLGLQRLIRLGQPSIKFRDDPNLSPAAKNLRVKFQGLTSAGTHLTKLTPPPIHLNAPSFRQNVKSLYLG